jgi:hypothetical protein
MYCVYGAPAEVSWPSSQVDKVDVTAALNLQWLIKLGVGKMKVRQAMK